MDEDQKSKEDIGIEDEGGSKALIKSLFSAPEDQEERVGAATLGVASLVSSGVIFLLRALTVIPVLGPIIGLTVSAVLGGMTWWITKKYPRYKSVAVVVGVVAGVTLASILPLLSGLGGFLMVTSGIVTAAYGLWKLGSVVFSIFRRKN